MSLRGHLSAKGRLLLAYLALQSGRAVSTGVIASEVFPDSAALDPHEVIKKTVQDVRRVLGVQGTRLTAPAPRTLALDMHDATFDWSLFHTAVKRGDSVSLHHAIALHSRPLLEEETLPWAQGEQAHCLALRGRALETLFHRAMQEGAWEEAGNWLLETLRFELPEVSLDEKLWQEWFARLLELKEHGRLHHHYMRMQGFLERTAGRLPAPETRLLWDRIPKATLHRLTSPVRKRGIVPESAHLPHVTSALIGRDSERRDLIGAFKNSRLVTIVGVGGVGKTRFAIQIGHEVGADYRDEVGFIDLTPCLPDGVLSSVASALGSRRRQDSPIVDALCETIGQQRILLILDNCEHRIEEVAALVPDLLSKCAQLRLLLTSRERLRVEGEQVFPLLPLALPNISTSRHRVKTAPEGLLESPAVCLFLERASAIHPEFGLTSQYAGLVARLCHLVDGLPLGIEIVASQVAAAPLERIVQDLQGQVLRLQDGRRGVAARHQTLQATLEYSYSMLNVEEQMLLRRLSVFAGGWTLEAAEVVCTDDMLTSEEIGSVLARLVAKSLVNFHVRGEEVLPFQFLETVRAFAKGKLQEHGEEAQYSTKHCLYFRNEAARLNDMTRIEQAVKQMRLYRTNLEAAITWAIADPASLEAGVQISCNLGAYWDNDGLAREGVKFADNLLVKAAHSLAPEMLAEMQSNRAGLARLAGMKIETEVVPLLHAALKGFEIAGNRAREADIYWQLADVVPDTPEVQQRDYYRLAQSLYREAGLLDRVTHMLLLSANCSYNMGLFDEAEAEMQAGLQLAEEGGYSSLRALAQFFLGTLARDKGEIDRAESLYGQSLAIYRQIDSGWAIRQLTALLGECQRLKRNYVRATALHRDALQLAVETDPPHDPSQTLYFAAHLFADLKKWETALFLYEGSFMQTPAYRAKSERVLSELEDHLGAEQCAEIREEAQQQSLTQICLRAMARLDDLLEP